MVATAVLSVLLLAACEAAEDADDTPDDEAQGEDAELADGLEDGLDGAAFAPDDDCFGLEVVDLDDDDVRCGRIEVPLDHDDPDGSQIELAVAVLWPGRGAETGDAGVADRRRPLLVLGGGPGEVMVEPTLTEPAAQATYETGRETIVLDQRGVGHSSPVLQCPSIDEDALQGTADEDLEVVLSAMAACRDDLAADGLDLGAFNHRNNALDVHAVRAALGHETIDLRGTSYGTHVALHAASLDPGRVGALVLSSPIDPTDNYLHAAAGGFQRALDLVGEACERDASCAQQVGDLDAAIVEAAGRLDTERPEVTVQPPGSEETTVTFTAERFVSSLFLLFYLPDGAFLLPALVDQARAGDVTQLAELLVAIEEQLEDAIAVGMHVSMVCTGEGARFDLDRARDGLRSQVLHDHWFSRGAVGGAATDRACDVWGVDGAVAPEELTLPEQVPALIVTGGFDHVTPPRLGAQVAAGLSTSHLVEVPTMGHAPLEALDRLAAGCGQQLVTAFLDAPAQTPDTGCVDALPPYQPLSELPPAPW
jgi:pimeloyl-ACP methyl ester carboxylesterase